MTNWHKQNEKFATWMIEELFKEKPFSLVLNSGDAGSLHAIAAQMHHEELVQLLDGRVKNGTGVSLEINQDNADKLYHVLSSYLSIMQVS